MLAATLLFPRIAYLLERPLAFMTRRRGGDLGGGFVLGVSLGLVFVPCAGPVLATITALSAQHQIGFDTVLLTLAYALGAAVPMLLIALGGQRVARRMRAHSQNFRRAMGVLLAGAAVRDHLQHVPEPPDARSAATRPRSRSTSRTRRSRRSTSTR